jgi:hypothetical protein
MPAQYIKYRKIDNIRFTNKPIIDYKIEKKFISNLIHPCTRLISFKDSYDIAGQTLQPNRLA